ncbi:MAG: efflux RND transporter periplasmic adaptor subunit [candidate division NC10 bacterium]|nr:efflux RND transporter periplasmic adaptor subunit [candidate division NC10 bacterium]
MRLVRPLTVQGSTFLAKGTTRLGCRRPSVERLWLLVPVLIGAALLVIGCSQEKPAKAAANPGGEPVIRITAAPVVARDVQRTVEMVGTLIPYDEVAVSSEVEGIVEKLTVRLGDRVKKGDLLVRLDQREARLNLEQAEASLVAARKALDRSKMTAEVSRANIERAKALVEDARVNLKRFEDLLAEGAVSASQRDSARTQYDVAVASLRSAEAQYESDLENMRNGEAQVDRARAAVEFVRKKLQDTEILAPITGAVRKRIVEVGEAVKERTPLVALVNVDPLKLQGTVPERYAPQVKIGQQLQVRVEAYPDRTFPGVIERISPSVDVETRSLTVEARVPNPQELLKSGFFAKALVVTKEEKGVPFIPEQALYYFVGITKAFVITDGKVQERQVKTGLRENGMVEIVEGGLTPGERVATSSLSQLFDGAKVQMVESAKK